MSLLLMRLLERQNLLRSKKYRSSHFSCSANLKELLVRGQLAAIAALFTELSNNL